MDVNVLLFFVDIRGFTAWSDAVEVSASLNEFVQRFKEIIQAHFPSRAYFLKGLGDGAMIVREVEGEMNAEVARDLLAEALATIETLSGEFKNLCKTFAEKIGHGAPLELGWGIVRGKVKRLGEKKADRDYVGANVNKCARLCDRARPFGLVVDREDFPELPAAARALFFPQTRRVAGLDEVEVWVTKEIATQFITREQMRQHPEVHIAGICVDLGNKRKPRILLARRSADRRLFPNKIEGCGGQLAFSETFAEGVKRHFRLEMQIEVRVLEDFHCFYVIKEPNEPVIPGIRFLCEQVDDKTPESKNHSRVWWATEAEFRAIPDDEFVGNLKEEVLDLLQRYKAVRG
jgi:class 3 adenylate cyclase